MSETGKHWHAYNPVCVHAGQGIIEKLPQLASEGRLLLVTTRGFTSRGITAHIENLLGVKRIVRLDSITPNPEIDYLEGMLPSLRQQSLTGIIALGGGSVIDSAKALSVSIPAPQKKPLTHSLRGTNPVNWTRKLTIIAVPTTAGSGSEVTPFAAIWDRTCSKKYSMECDALFPSIALLDPELTKSLPKEMTLYTALDSISHSLESLWNKNRNPVSTAYAIHSLSLTIPTLPFVLKNPDSTNGRTYMQQASLLSGLAISQTRTAIAHSISYPLTIHFRVPHGLACGFTLPVILTRNMKHLSLCPSHRNIIKKVLSLLNSLRLHTHIKKYLTLKQAMNLTDKMYNKDRLGNYLIESENISTIVAKSFSGKLK